VIYRSLGQTGEKVSVLGFGCMRLPVIEGQRDRIDLPLATEMVHYAIDHGVNYFDTAFGYHGSAFDKPGESEVFLGEALQGGLREKVLIATKLPQWLVKTRDDMDVFLAGQLERLQTDCIDCYLLHALGAEPWAKMTDLGVCEFLDAAKADGRIRYVGFSYHDVPAAFAPIVDGYDWDFCQIQYNYMDVENQAGAAGLAHAVGKGLGVVVMEPLRGGRLAGRVPEAVQALWDTSAVRRTPVEWALRFVWDDPGVSLLLSGMSDMQHVIDNIEIAERAEVGRLNDEQLALIGKVRDAYRARTAVGCTECRYCMPCPQNIDIPGVFSTVNSAALYDNLAADLELYEMMVGDGRWARASACVECGQCEDACPQKVPVIEEMAKAAQLLDAPR
jgi:uncharacterized protein